MCTSAAAAASEQNSLETGRAQAGEREREGLSLPKEKMREIEKRLRQKWNASFELFGATMFNGCVKKNSTTRKPYTFSSDILSATCSSHLLHNRLAYLKMGGTWIIDLSSTGMVSDSMQPVLMHPFNEGHPSASSTVWTGLLCGKRIPPSRLLVFVSGSERPRAM